MPGAPYSPRESPYAHYPNGSPNWQWLGSVNPNFNASADVPNVNAAPNLNINPFVDPVNATLNINSTVTVDTASLSAFGQWVSTELTDALSPLRGQLQDIKVEPGAFYWADYVRAYINGTSPNSGLAYQFMTVIEDLLDGLASISSGVHQLVQLYANTEDLNSAQAANLESDLSSSFANAYSYFNTVGSDSQSPNIAPQS